LLECRFRDWYFFGFRNFRYYPQPSASYLSTFAGFYKCTGMCTQHTHMHTHMQTHTHLRTHTTPRVMTLYRVWSVWQDAEPQTHTHTNTLTHTHSNTYTHTHTHTYTHTHTNTHTHTHTHTHAHTHKPRVMTFLLAPKAMVGTATSLAGTAACGSAQTFSTPALLEYKLLSTAIRCVCVVCVYVCVGVGVGVGVCVGVCGWGCGCGCVCGLWVRLCVCALKLWHH